MTTIINKSINIDELFLIVKSCYPDSLSFMSSFLIILVDNNDNLSYNIWLKKPNVFQVIPRKAFWNRTFVVKARAQEIADRIRDYIENGETSVSSGIHIPDICPHCKNPNTKKIRLCEWCGNQIV